MSDFNEMAAQPLSAEALRAQPGAEADREHRSQLRFAGALKEQTAGMDSLTEFLKEQYLCSYIPDGGSKIKLVTGRPGSGKTHLASLISQDAEELGYITVFFSAKETWLHDFREVYLEILRQCSIERILKGCADQIVREMGIDPAEIGDEKTLMDYLAENGKADALSRNVIRDNLRRMFMKNPLLDNCFAGCCSLLTGAILGHPVLEPASRDLLMTFLYGDKTVKLAQLRALGLSPSRITKYNARNLLRSLSETVRMAGFQGLLVVIDDMEMLLNRAAGTSMRYTKMRREDSYESIRQLIDDIDNMHHILFLLCFDRELMDNENYGMKSYQALWMRVQNEVVSSRFNRFADILDLDRYGEEMYDTPVLLKMASCMKKERQRVGLPAAELTPEDIEMLKERARYGGFGLPYLIRRAVDQEGETGWQISMPGI